MKKSLRFILILFTAIYMMTALGFTAQESRETVLNETIGALIASKKNAQYDLALNTAFVKPQSGVRETINPENGSIQTTLPIVSIPSVNGMSLDVALTYRGFDAKEFEEGVVEDPANPAKKINQNIEKTKAEQERAVFGIGWTLSLPYVETRPNVGTFVSLPSGGMYRADFLTSSGLSGYTLGDMVFQQDDTLLVSGKKSAYRLTEADGMRWYFSTDGKLIEKKDRFQNAISYHWDKFADFDVLRYITDGFGRKISFTYSENQINITWGDASSYTLYVKPAMGSIGNLLLGARDAMGNLTELGYQKHDINYSLEAGIENIGTNQYYALSEVKYHTGARTVYNYQKSRKSSGSGYMDYLRISERKELDGAGEYHKIRYAYWGEADGYPQHAKNTLPKTYQYIRSMTYQDGKTETITYNNQHLPVKREISASGKKKQTQITSFHPTTLAPKLVYTTSYNETGGESVLIEEYDFDRNGNMIYYDQYQDGERGKRAISRIYSLAYNLLTREEQQLDENTRLTTAYELAFDQMKPVSKTVYENSMPLSHAYYQYDTHGNLTEEKTEVNRGQFAVTRYEYSNEYGGAYLTAKTSVNVHNADRIAENITERYTYSKTGKLLTKTDGEGNRYTYTYDRNGRVVEEGFPNSTRNIYRYDDKNSILEQENRAGTKLRYSYDRFGNLKTIADKADGKILVSYEYDMLWRKTKTTDACGNYDTLTYGDLDRVTRADSYDAKGKHLSQTNLHYNDAVKRDGKTLTMLTVEKGLQGELQTEQQYYDLLGNLILKEKAAKSGTAVEYYGYDLGGRNTLYTDAYGGQIKTEYDALGNAVKVTNQQGEVMTYTYNLASQKTGERDENGYCQYYGYDEIGRVVRTREMNVKNKTDERLTKKYYDKNGNLIKTVNQLGEETSYAYDTLNRLVLQKNGEEKDGEMVSSYRYNELDQIIESAYGEKEKNVTGYRYDRFGRKTQEIDAMGNSSYYKYDAVGNMIEKKDRNGVVTSYSYDGLNRLTEERNTKDKTPTTYRYDSHGQMLSAKDATGTYRFYYDERGQLEKIINPDQLEQRYRYDIGSRVTSYEQIRNGTVEQKLMYHYDQAGRLTATETPAGKVMYGYDRAGQLTRERNEGTNTETVYTYSPMREITEISILQNGALLDHQTYSYDALGRRATECAQGKLKSYYYDSQNRLKYEMVSKTGASFGGVLSAEDSMKEYGYDEHGNISGISEWVGGRKYLTNYSYDKNNRLIYQKDYEKSYCYSYDKEGNLLEKEEYLTGGRYSTRYRWNGKNQMSEYIDPDGVRSSYEYRHDGLRANKTVDGIKTAFAYNGGNITSEQVYDERVRSYQYYRGLRLVAMENERGEQSYFRHNAHGDVVGLADSTGAEIKNYDYTAFGEQVGADDHHTRAREEERLHNPFGYAGEYRDAETGLIYLRARYYDPTIGRFLSEDPYWNTENMIYGDDCDKTPDISITLQSSNLYIYCANNPVEHIDFSGCVMTGDKEEFGGQSDTYKILVDLGKRWSYTSNPHERSRLHKIAQEARRLARSGTPFKYGQDIVMDTLHTNAQTANNYMNQLRSYAFYDWSRDFDNKVAYLISMTNHGEWDYKYNPDWQVPYSYFNGKNMNVDNNKNWIPWIYFDGMIMAADKFGNMNMAYVGVKMGLPNYVYQNFTTEDGDDKFWVQYGIDLANSGR